MTNFLRPGFLTKNFQCNGAILEPGDFTHRVQYGNLHSKSQQNGSQAMGSIAMTLSLFQMLITFFMLADLENLTRSEGTGIHPEGTGSPERNRYQGIVCYCQPAHKSGGQCFCETHAKRSQQKHWLEWGLMVSVFFSNRLVCRPLLVISGDDKRMGDNKERERICNFFWKIQINFWVKKILQWTKTTGMSNLNHDAHIKLYKNCWKPSEYKLTLSRLGTCLCISQ